MLHWLKLVLLTSLFTAGFLHNAFGQDCNGADGFPVTGGLNLVANGDVCANSAINPGQLGITANNVNDLDTPANVTFFIDWNDGTTQTIGPGAPITYGGAGTHSYTTVVTHLFPASGATKCEYIPFVRLRMKIAGVFTNCPGTLGTPPRFIRWNTDNQAPGVLNVSDQATTATNFLVCAGSTANVTFQDRSTLNCINIAQEPGGIPFNLGGRQRRFVYGTTNTITTAIGVKVGGSVRTYPFNGAIISTTTPSSALPAPTTSLVITVPPDAVVGQFFEITMQYWNTCNPVTPVTTTARITITNAPAPLTAAGLALCYGAATPVNFSVGGVAGGASAINFYNKNPLAGGATLMQTGGAGSTNYSSNNYGANGGVGGNFSTTNASGAYYSVWATQVIGSANACQSVPVEVAIIQQRDLSANLPATPAGLSSVCNGPPNNAQTYSEAVAPVNMTIPVTTFANTSPITLLTEDFWSIGAFGAGVTLAPFTGSSVTVNYNRTAQPATFVTANVNVQLRYQAQFISINPSPVPAPYTPAPYSIVAKQCANGPASLPVNLYGQTLGGSINMPPSSTICDGANTDVMTISGHRGSIVKWQRTLLGVTTDIVNTLATYSEVPPSGPGVYTYNAVVQNASGGPCPVQNSTVGTITVNPVPPTPALTLGAGSTGGFTICEDGVQKVVLQSSNAGGVGVRFDFLKGATVIQTGASSTYTITTASQSGSYTVIVYGTAPTVCPSTPSPAQIVMVNPLPTATVSGGGSVCSGAPAPDIVWTLTGTGPYTLSYTDGTTPFGPIGSVAGPTFTLTGPTVSGNYKLTSLVDNNTCTADAAGL